MAIEVCRPFIVTTHAYEHILCSDGVSYGMERIIRDIPAHCTQNQHGCITLRLQIPQLGLDFSVSGCGDINENRAV